MFSGAYQDVAYCPAPQRVLRMPRSLGDGRTQPRLYGDFDFWRWFLEVVSKFGAIRNNSDQQWLRNASVVAHPALFYDLPLKEQARSTESDEHCRKIFYRRPHAAGHDYV